MRGHHNDRQARLRCMEPLDQLDPAQARQPEIREHEIAALRCGEGEPGLGAGRAEHVPVFAFEHTLQFARDAGVVFHQQDGRATAHDCIAGSTMPKVVPWLIRVRNWSAPPCRSTMRAAMERPRPVPLPFVVKKGSKSRF